MDGKHAPFVWMLIRQCPGQIWTIDSFSTISVNRALLWLLTNRGNNLIKFIFVNHSKFTLRFHLQKSSLVFCYFFFFLIYLLLLNEQKLYIYIYIYLYHVSILKTAWRSLMKQTLLTSFEDEKAIGPGLDLDKTHLNWSFLN